MIKIVTDTAASLPAEIVEQYGLYLVPQYIVFGQTAYREFYDLKSDAFYRMQAEADELPKTSAPSPADVRDIFEAILSETPDATILCIFPSSDVSGTIRSARPAAADYPNADIRIFDTRSISLGEGLMVIEAARMVQEGAGIEAVLERLSDMRDRMEVYFVVDTLEYLHKGGRIGRATHLIGSVLDIKPVLALVDGVVESVTRYRTRRRAMNDLVEMVEEKTSGQTGLKMAVLHAICEEDGQYVVEQLQAAIDPEEMLFGEVGPAVGVHAGPGTLGVCWYASEE